MKNYIALLVVVAITWGIGFTHGHHIMPPEEECNNFNKWLYASEAASSKVACFVDERENDQYCLRYMGKVKPKSTGDVKKTTKKKRTKKKAKK